jgi:phosphoglycolate phosphatase
MIVKDIEVVVFDFDGTLVLSNQLKYDAYFKLFPDEKYCRSVIKQVLEEILEESRFVILGAIVERIKRECSVEIVPDISQLAEQYNDIVLDGAKKCIVRPGTIQVLETLKSDHSLYVSSNTPEKPLKEIIDYRQWTGYFKGVCGYPKRKYQTLLEIIDLEKKIPTQVLVVGDGESDRNSARQAGCHFFYVTPHIDLQDVLKRTL